MIDINCDLGEGLNNEDLIMPFISSCNISCGAHAGSIEIIDKVISIAVKNKVKIGAHPGYEDRENFGRIILDVSDEELSKSLVNQLKLFKKRAELQNVKVHHVKPHGALYNLIAENKKKAKLVLNCINKVFNNVAIYAPYKSVVSDIAEANGVKVIYEVFADRNYNEDLTLVARNKKNATITSTNKIISHVSKIVYDKRVKTISGKEKYIIGDTFCVHGDNKNVLNIVRSLNKKFNLG